MKKEKIEHTLLVHFNTVASPYLELYDYENNVLVKTDHFSLEEGYGEQSVADLISSVCPKVDTMYLLLSDNGIFKTTLTFPKLRFGKTEKMYKTECRAYLPYAETHRSFYERYEHTLGVIYYTYFVPTAPVDLFRRVAALLKCKFAGYDLFIRYLKTMLGKEKENYLFYYTEYGLSYMLLSYGGVLSAFSYCYATEEEYKKEYFTTIGKHFFELEKKNVDSVYIVAPVVVRFFGKTATWIKISFDKFLPEGVRL